MSVGDRAGHAQPYVVPVDVGLQSVIDESSLLVQLIDELAAQRMGMFRSPAIFGDDAVSLVEKVCGCVRGIRNDPVKRIINISFKLALVEFPQIVG